MTAIAFSGHRPPKLDLTYEGDGPGDARVIDDMTQLLDTLQATSVITGLALGVDQLAVKAANILGLPYDAYIPFPGQDGRWPERSQSLYRVMVTQAREVLIISDRYSPRAFQDRNVAMVEASDWLIAYWDGSSGGTANCIKYARSIGHPRMIRRGT